jgi:hypothetical protein
VLEKALHRDVVTTGLAQLRSGAALLLMRWSLRPVDHRLAILTWLRTDFARLRMGRKRGLRKLTPTELTLHRGMIRRNMLTQHVPIHLIPTLLAFSQKALSVHRVELEHMSWDWVVSVWTGEVG